MYVMLIYESDLSELQFGVCDPCSLFNTTCVVTKRPENFLIDLINKKWFEPRSNIS